MKNMFGKLANIGSDSIGPPMFEEPKTETRIIKVWKWNFEKGPKPLDCPTYSEMKPVDRELHLWVELTGTYEHILPPGQGVTHG